MYSTASSSTITAWRWGAWIVLLGVMLMIGTTVPVFAESSNDFSQVSKHLHRQVTVETTDGQLVKGDLVRVEDNRLVVYEAGTTRSIARESIRKVTRHKSRHTAAWVAGMSAAGLGAGFLMGFRAYDDAVNSNQKLTAATFGGAGAGAAVGFGLSRIGKAEEIIYEVPVEAAKQ